MQYQSPYSRKIWYPPQKKKHIPNATKFGTQSRSSLLIINMIFEIADLDPKLKTWTDLVSNCNVLQFL